MNAKAWIKAMTAHAYVLEEAVVPLRMPQSIFDRLLKAAKFS